MRLDRQLEGWLVTHGPLRSERTQATDRARVRHLCDFFGSKDLSRLTESDCRRFAASMLQAKSPGLVTGCLSILRRVLNLAVEEGDLARNPIPSMHRVMRDCDDSGDERPDAWTWDETKTLLDLAQGTPAEAPLAFALSTGCRRGEVLALRWEDVDFRRRRVTIRRNQRLGNRATGRGKEDWQRRTKSTKGRHKRTVPLSDELLARLDRLRHQLPLGGWVFPAPEGGLWDESNFAKRWARLRERAKARGVRPLKFHTTRSTFITRALEAGLSTKVVSQVVGASQQVIEKHYAADVDLAGVDMAFSEQQPHLGASSPTFTVLTRTSRV